MTAEITVFTNSTQYYLL